ncbi:acyltransferase family protein [Pseudonocardia nematodicida]|uniref:Acyltransferase family protein n=1 Tax=Pseudonocardia nematodicida TaxID=1206997 RepID=A0ABV1KB25_9PSEU
MTSTVPAAAPPAASTDTRRHGLDALRAIALGLGIVLHSLLPFVPDMPWMVTDSVTDPAAVVPVYVIHLFRMVLFMLLAGYFGRMLLTRRGPREFVRDRLTRIGLPLVAFWPVSVMSLWVLSVVGVFAFGQPIPEMVPPAEGTPEILQLFTPGQLWFLLVLIECVLAVVVLRAVAIRLLGAERVARFTRAAGTVLSSRAGMLLAAVPYLLALLIQGTVAGGIVEPFTIVPELAPLVGYLGAFMVGWALHARPDSIERIGRTWPVQLGIAVPATVLGWFVSHGEVPLPVAAAVVALAGMTWTYGLIGLFGTVLDRRSEVMRYLADSAYWGYLLHLPVLVGIELLIADQSWPILAKLALTWTVTAVLLLVSYDVLVRSTWIGAWLNGRRRRSVLLRRG